MRDEKGRFIKGHVCPEEWKVSISEVKTGVLYSDAHKKAISLGNKGKIRTKEIWTKRKIGRN